MTGAEGIDLNTAGDVFLAESAGGNSVQKWVGGSLSSTIDPLGDDVYVDQSSATGHAFTAYEGRIERQIFAMDATAGQFRLSFGGEQTSDLPFDADQFQIDAALEALPGIGANNVRVDALPSPNEMQVSFEGLLGQTDVNQLVCEDGTTPLSGGAGCSVSTLKDGIPSDVQEYASDGTLLATFGAGDLANASSVAYNSSLDRLYAMLGSSGSRNPSVVAFGPITTGTAPDATIDAPTGVGVSSAHFSGTVNPQGTTSEWHFQWRTGEESWTTAPSSPPQSLPVDSSDHTVEFTTEALRGSTSYQVRLVAENTENHLTGVSASKNFATNEAAQAPEVTIATPSAITTAGATISGTVNPQGDTADWRVQTSTDPACEGGFKDEPLQSISPSSSSPVPAEYEVTELSPSERYCVRIVATNSAGSTASEAKELETGEVLPTRVFTAYAAPRTDTSARLNGYVNPHGSEATYRFEYSEDGSSWTALPDGQTTEDRRQVTVASELSGLQPSTTYSYRFVAETSAGPVSGEEKTFQTRSLAEMSPPQRGIELVNQPNKGNQALSVESIGGDLSLVRTDGERLVWRLLGGAPGGNTGTSVGFLATRTSQGWTSQAIAPPAEQQVGGGGYAYKLSLVTPDFRHFLVRALQTGAQQNEPATFVRIDDEYHQEVLEAFSEAELGQLYENADMTTDGKHVVLFKPETGQLKEIGPQEEVVSIMPDGEPAECALDPTSFFGPSSSASPTGIQWQSTYHRMAVTDASRVYFAANPNGGSCSSGPAHYEALYYRDREAGQTIEIDAGSDREPPALIRTTPDGRAVYFLSVTSHSPDDENATGDMYRWDADSAEYTCLTCVVPDASLSAYSPVRISEDFSHLYFGSPKQLIPGYGDGGSQSIYSLDLSTGDLRYVASEDGRALGSAQLSRDGNVLLFKAEFAEHSLTADREAGECFSFLVDTEKGFCDEVFRYEADDESLECLSCLPGGVTTHSVGEMNAAAALSADGRTVAFVSKERISPADINSAPDVYEWRDGAVRLISDGETDYVGSSFNSAPRIYGIDSSGNNIFFTIVQPGLTGYEQDKASNLYDARVGGGFPRPQEPAHCSEESCQGPLQAPPEQAAIGSSGLAGSGNPSAARKGGCAAKKAKAKRHCQRGRKRHRHAKGGAAGKRASTNNAGAGK